MQIKVFSALKGFVLGPIWKWGFSERRKGVPVTWVFNKMIFHDRNYAAGTQLYTCITEIRDIPNIFVAWF